MAAVNYTGPQGLTALSPIYRYDNTTGNFDFARFSTGGYVGYNGSHPKYGGVSIYQNGGTLGLVGMAYKGNFF